MRLISAVIDFALFLILTLLGCLLIWHRPTEMREDSAAVLAGALFGAAALLLGNWINRWNESRREQKESDEKVTKLRALISAKLVRVAAALLYIKDLIDAALVSQGACASDLLTHFPSAASVTEALGNDLLVLDVRAIDVLVTLETNLELARRSLEKKAAEDSSPLILLTLIAIHNSIASNLGVLAECFEHIVPERMFTVGESDPEPVATVLRRKAQPPPRPRGAPGLWPEGQSQSQ